MTPRLTRAGFIEHGALVLGGAVALAAAGCGGSSGTTLVGAPLGTIDDAAIGRVALAAESLAMDLYARAARTAGVAPAMRDYLESARENERAHRTALSAALGESGPSGLRFAYPPGAFGAPAAAMLQAAALEQALVGQYLGAVSQLRDVGLRLLAARIAANHAQHLGAVSSPLGGDPAAVPSLPAVLTTLEAADAVAPFLA